MTAGFKPELVQPILDGTKIHTFRGGHNWRLGLDVQFVIHNRTPRRAEFRERVPVASLQVAELREEGLLLDGHQLDPLELALFAQQDGFADTTSFLAFFAKRERPLVGQLIHWTPFRYLRPAEVADPAVVADYLCRLVEAQPVGAAAFGQHRKLLRTMVTVLGEVESTRLGGRPCTVATVVADLQQLNPREFLREVGVSEAQQPPSVEQLRVAGVRELVQAQQSGTGFEELTRLLGGLTAQLAPGRLLLAAAGH